MNQYLNKTKTHGGMLFGTARRQGNLGQAPQNTLLGVCDEICMCLFTLHVSRSSTTYKLLHLVHME